MPSEKTSREIYTHAPLQLVAFELRTSQVPEFGSQQGSVALYEELRDQLPVIPAAPQPFVSFPSANIPQATFFQSHTALQMLNRRRTLFASVAPSLILVQTTDYTRFEEFREFIASVLAAASRVAKIAAIERVGLRYIDEIRIEGVERPEDWAPYINPPLLGPTQNEIGLHATSWTASVDFDTDDQLHATVRTGALRGRVVDPSGPLQLRSEADGPFFLIDVDSYWAPNVDELPEFTEESVVGICSALHEPARGLFESALTDRTRDVFRGGGGSNEHG